MKKTIKVYDILKTKAADDQSKGNIIFEAIVNTVKTMNNKYQNNEIILDFKNIELINTAFLNNAVGKLLDKSQYNINKNNVFIENMDEQVIELLKEVISVARDKYL